MGTYRLESRSDKPLPKNLVGATYSTYSGAMADLYGTATNSPFVDVRDYQVVEIWPAVTNPA